MRLHRFYVQEPLGEELHIDTRELVHQWSSVFRYKAGDSVLLFSLASPSYDYRYIIVSIDKSKAILAFVEKHANILPKRTLSLFMSVVKKDTFEHIVRQATELMVTDITPVLATRSEKKNLNFERLSAIAKEAAEQCGRGDIPTINDILTLEEAALLANKNHLLFDKSGGSLPTTSTIDAVWIGPEGGWTDSELFLLKEKMAVATLGDSILRADTAALVGIAKVFF